MKKVIFAAVVLAIAFNTPAAFATYSPGGQSSAYVNIEQGQYQTVNNYTAPIPFGFATMQSAEQGQWNQGSAYRGFGSAEQYEEQGAGDSYSVYTPYGQMSQGGGVSMQANNYGFANWKGNFGSDSSQEYDSSMYTDQIGPYSMKSGIYEGFNQSLSGYVCGSCSGVGNSLNMNANNEYAQFANNGQDWSEQYGSSYANANLQGAAWGPVGVYGASIDGFQFGGTETFQDGSGNYQSGNQFAVSSLSIKGYDIGVSNVFGSASAGQVHNYSQYNEGVNSFQYQSGSVETSVSVSQW